MHEHPIDDVSPNFAKNPFSCFHISTHVFQSFTLLSCQIEITTVVLEQRWEYLEIHDVILEIYSPFSDFQNALSHLKPYRHVERLRKLCDPFVILIIYAEGMLSGNYCLTQ